MNVSLEDYLKNIYTIKLTKGKVTTSVLADKLSVSPAAVSDMVSKLDKAGYIKNMPYKGFELTSKGEAVALNLIRKHRLWEVFLVKYLMYPWDKVHEEAEKLEHSSSDELIEKLEEYMGFPESDPHGHPIPDSKGKITELKSFPLSTAEIGQEYIIKTVSDESSELLIYLTKTGLKLNDKIKLAERISFDNSVHIVHSSERIFLSEKLAERIYVIPFKQNSRKQESK